jgi:hypothetical protein
MTYTPGKEGGEKKLKSGVMAQAHQIFYDETGIEISLAINRALRKIIKINYAK